MRIQTIAAAFLLLAAAPPPANSNVAIKLSSDNDRINPLPLSAAEAARRFGSLTNAQIQAVTSVSNRLLGEMCASSKSAWRGPELFVSHATELDYRNTTLASVCKELGGQTITTYDPYSLGKQGSETDAVVMVRTDPGAGGKEKWTAVAFVLNDDAVTRIVVAPQPWVTLMPGRR